MIMFPAAGQETGGTINAAESSWHLNTGRTKKKHENSRLALSIINCQGVYTIHLLLHTGLLSATVK